MNHNIPPSTPIKGNKYQKLNNNARSQSAHAGKGSYGSNFVATSTNSGLITPQTVSRFKTNTIKQATQQQLSKKKNFLQTPKPKTNPSGLNSTAGKRIYQTPQNNDEDIREKLLSDMFSTPNIFNPTTPVLKLQFDSDSDNDVDESYSKSLYETPKNKIMTFEQSKLLHNDSSKKDITNKNKKLTRGASDSEEVFIRNKIIKNPFLSDEDDEKNMSDNEKNLAVKRLSFK
ncbi:hypothetical protein QEN19_000386 [Hanseniaspora menglaensis]